VGLVHVEIEVSRDDGPRLQVEFLEDTDAMSPVVLGGRGDVALLGAVTLETLGLVLNPFTWRLKPARMTLARPEPRSVCRIVPPPAPESTVESLIEALVTGPRADPEFLETVEAITRAQPCLPRSPWDE
jgi:hypothetical protein